MSDVKDIFESFEQAGVEISPELRNKLTKQIKAIDSYEPRVGVFGKTGVGKSSLCNAVFGRDVCKISDVAACTREPQEILLSITQKGLRLVDVPGVGESESRDEEYALLYQNLLPELDVVLWVLKADDRAFSSDESFYKQVVKPHMEQGKAFFIVLNQVDKVEPFRDWSVENCQPSATQAKHIEEKRKSVSAFFDLPLEKVIPVSAHEKFGLIALVDAVVHALPKEKKRTFIKQVAYENQSKEAIIEAEKSYLEVVIDLVVKVLPNIKTIIEVGKSIFNGLKSLLK